MRTIDARHGQAAVVSALTSVAMAGPAFGQFMPCDGAATYIGPIGGSWFDPGHWSRGQQTGFLAPPRSFEAAALDGLGGRRTIRFEPPGQITPVCAVLVRNGAVELEMFGGELEVGPGGLVVPSDSLANAQLTILGLGQGLGPTGLSSTQTRIGGPRSGAIRVESIGGPATIFRIDDRFGPSSLMIGAGGVGSLDLVESRLESMPDGDGAAEIVLGSGPGGFGALRLLGLASVASPAAASFVIGGAGRGELFIADGVFSPRVNGPIVLGREPGSMGVAQVIGDLGLFDPTDARGNPAVVDVGRGGGGLLIVEQEGVFRAGFTRVGPGGRFVAASPRVFGPFELAGGRLDVGPAGAVMNPLVGPGVKGLRLDLGAELSLSGVPEGSSQPIGGVLGVTAFDPGLGAVSGVRAQAARLDGTIEVGLAPGVQIQPGASAVIIEASGGVSGRLVGFSAPIGPDGTRLRPVIEPEAVAVVAEAGEPLGPTIGVTPQTFPPGAIPGRVVDAVPIDLNGDSRVDLALISELGENEPGAVTLLLARPAGSPQEAGTPLGYLLAGSFPTPGRGPFSAASGRFDARGLPSLAILNRGETVGQASVVEIDPGSFQPASVRRFSVPGDAIALASGDLNGDGLTDLLVTSESLNAGVSASLVAEPAQAVAVLIGFLTLGLNLDETGLGDDGFDTGSEATGDRPSGTDAVQGGTAEDFVAALDPGPADAVAPGSAAAAVAAQGDNAVVLHDLTPVQRLAGLNPGASAAELIEALIRLGPPRPFPSIQEPVGVIRAQINGPGEPDIVAVGLGGQLAAHLDGPSVGTPTGTLAPPAVVKAGAIPGTVIVFDRDGDGDDEIAFLTRAADGRVEARLIHNDTQPGDSLVRLSTPAPLPLLMGAGEPARLLAIQADDTPGLELVVVYDQASPTQPGFDPVGVSVIDDGRNPADLAQTGGAFGTLDGNDISLFVAAFLGQQPPADLAPTGGAFGTFDGNDISAFVSAFLNP